MCNPISLDEVYVQATHLEARGKDVPEEGKKKPFKGGEKGKGLKGKINKIIHKKIRGENHM